MTATEPSYDFSLVEASISDIQAALSSGSLTSVELLTKILHRISTYDCHGISLNAIPIINPQVLDEAAASDERRSKGQLLGPLDGVPWTVKDSYQVKGMTVGAGSPAFQDLISSRDAFIVERLRAAGAVLVGRTNMPPMACGGMQRGVYGRAENPYNLDYLAAAFMSGSSNGSAVATAASFAAFGMGSETVSSGRSPASNNGLIAYTPSKGWISCRGIWPLYPTCDVAVPHTRTMDDLFLVLDAIVAKDDVTAGDFWRDQKLVKLPEPWITKPSSFCQLTTGSLAGVRLAIPEMYIGGTQLTNGPAVHTSEATIALWQRAKADLEALGATVVSVQEFPLVEYYENPEAAPKNAPHLPEDWNTIERSTLIAHAWESFLQDNADPHICSLRDVNATDIYPPHPPDDPQIRYAEPKNKVHYDKLAPAISHLPRNGDPEAIRKAIYKIPKLDEALQALEDMRKVHFEDWLTANHLDGVVFPAAGDVGGAQADVDYDAAEYAWRNGIKYSNGNRALRHLGVPSVLVTMGLLESKKVPIGLTFCGRAGSDVELLRWAKAYEAATQQRTEPFLTPALQSDFLKNEQSSSRRQPPSLEIETCTIQPRPGRSGLLMVEIGGYVEVADQQNEGAETAALTIEIFIDSSSVPTRQTKITDTSIRFECVAAVPAPPEQNEKNKVASRTKIARDSTMVVVTAKVGRSGRPNACLRML